MKKKTCLPLPLALIFYISAHHIFYAEPTDPFRFSCSSNPTAVTPLLKNPNTNGIKL